jgi:hypothetical protein
MIIIFLCEALSGRLSARVTPAPSRRDRGARQPGRRRKHPLYVDALNLIEADVVASPVVKLRGARGGVIGHRRRILQRAAAFQVRRDAGCAERVVADRRANPGRLGTAPHHRIGVRLRQRPRAQMPRAARDCAKQWPLRFITEAALFEVLVEVRLERMVAGHLMALAAFFMEAHP